MKSTGIVRKVDELGRVVIPIELRRTLGIDEKDALEIYTDNEKTGLHRMREKNGGKSGPGQQYHLKRN